jgi:AcrR family transcriptional regulator
VPRGRRPGESGSRERILAAARAVFAAGGYAEATIRAIAARAKVDPALVLHYFGSKEGVFAAAMEFPFDPAEVIPGLLEPGLEELGERLARFFFQTWDGPRGRPLVGLLRSAAGNQRAAEMLRDFVSEAMIGRLAAALPAANPRLRASLVGSQLIGAAVLRYVVGLEPLASASVDELAEWLGPTLQEYLTRAAR